MGTGAAGGEPELAVQRRVAEQEAYSTDLVSTPFLTQATPLLGGATPQYGAVTPHHTTPSRSTATPTWGTPAYSSQTPRGGPQTPRSAPGHGKATTPSYSGIEDVWRPRELPNSKSSGKSPLHSMSPGSFNYLAFSGHSKAKSPMFDGSRASTPTYQPPSVMPPTSKSGAWCVNGAEAELEDGYLQNHQNQCPEKYGDRRSQSDSSSDAISPNVFTCACQTQGWRQSSCC